MLLCLLLPDSLSFTPFFFDRSAPQRKKTQKNQNKQPDSLPRTARRERISRPFPSLSVCTYNGKFNKVGCLGEQGPRAKVRSEISNLI
jgi:hypothetical protein